MSTYEDKKKMMALFPKGTKVLVEMETVKDPKLSPFKIVKYSFFIIFFLKYIFIHIGNSCKFNSK